MKKPFRCPVCEGRGSVDSNFYLQSAYGSGLETTPCRSCDGTGIVWSSEVEWRSVSSDNISIDLSDEDSPPLPPPDRVIKEGNDPSSPKKEKYVTGYRGKIFKVKED